MSTAKERSSKEHIDKIVKNYYINGYVEGLVEVGEDKTCMHVYYNKYANDIKHFHINNDDIFVASYPKAGTTWTQEMVWLIANNADFEGAKCLLGNRFPFLESCTLFNYQKMDVDMGTQTMPSMIDSIDYIKNLPRPRLIKTHLPYPILPQEIKDGIKSPKIVYVMRNPKDVCVSYYHHFRLLIGYAATFQDYVDLFLSERILFGSYWKHVLGYLKHKDSLNILIITYEEMKENLTAVIKKVAKFLEKELTDEQIDKLVQHLSFDSMKNNKFVNLEGRVQKWTEHKFSPGGSFIRNGTVGNYKTVMMPEDIERFKAWSRKYIESTEFQEYKHMCNFYI